MTMTLSCAHATPKGAKKKSRKKKLDTQNDPPRWWYRQASRMHHLRTRSTRAILNDRLYTRVQTYRAATWNRRWCLQEPLPSYLTALFFHFHFGNGTNPGYSTAKPLTRTRQQGQFVAHTDELSAHNAATFPPASTRTRLRSTQLQTYT